MDGLDIQDIQAVLGRSDFVGGIDNEALDFSQLEDFINDDTDASHTYFGDTLTSNESRNVITSVNVVDHGSSRHHLGVAKPDASCPAFRQPNPSYTHPHSLPESPPDSGSEPPYSPQAHSPHQKNGTLLQTELLMQTPVYSKPSLLVQHQGLLTPLLGQADNSGVQTNNPLVLAAAHAGLHTEDQTDPGMATIYTSLTQGTKKRKLSISDDSVRVKQETDVCGDEELSFQDGSAEGSLYLDSSSFQCIRFQPFQQSSWHTLCDQNLKDLHTPHYRVDADKGFNFSNADDSFVCQKKNHFQITCHTQLQGDAQFVKTPDGFRKISSFHLHFYGVKVESPSQTIKVEQSQSDRSKKAFHPVLVDWHGEQVTKVTVGRLHFSETTSNNMRKKGKPNPDQRYFYLVVGLHAHCSDNNHYSIVSHASERIIVRASNPGQFESDVELCWQRGSAADSIYHAGRVGVNTDRPDEALVVHGNMKVTGHIVQPSDLRAKRDIQECDSAQQLMNVRNLRVVKYRYDPEFSNHCGLETQSDTGIIAQELRNILPEAVMPAGDVLLPSGTRIDNFLVVNKERILMESVGAVKELCKVTDNLETRIGELERINKRLVKLKKFDSLKSNNSAFTSAATRAKLKGLRSWDDEDDSMICSNQLIQVTIVVLILIMAMCLMAMVTLYILEYQKRVTFGFTEVSNIRISDNSIQTRVRTTTTNSYWTLDVRPNVTDYTNLKNDPKYPGLSKKHAGIKKTALNGVTRESQLVPSHECSVAGFLHSCQGKGLCCSSRPFQPDNLHSITHQEQQYQFQKADATPATNAIEELSDNGSQDPLDKEEIHKQQRDWLPKKDDLLLQKKRQTDDFPQPENAFSSADFSSGQDQLGLSLVMLGSVFNTTAEHCNHRPSFHNVTCVVHLNQHLTDPNITLFLKLARGGRVELCQETRIHKCRWPIDLAPTIELDDNIFNLHLPHSLATMLTFRLPLPYNSPSSVCREPQNRLGDNFVEYNLYLFQECQH